VNPFWIFGGILALWAVVLTFVLGLRSEEFPRTDSQMKAVMAVSAILVALAIGSGVYAAAAGIGEGKGVRHGPEPAGHSEE
jgi:hypothetical protein